MFTCNYSPNSQQKFQLDLLIQIAQDCEKDSVLYWLTGGYAYDVMFGELTRDHGDYDFFVHEKSEQKFIQIIENLGFVLNKKKIKEDTQTILYVYYKEELKLEFVLIREVSGVYYFGINAFSKLELPQQPFGKLNNTLILTPTLEAHQRLDKIVDRGTYVYLEHREKLIQALMSFSN